MKVLLVGNYIEDQQESMQRFTALMQHGLAREGHEVKVLRPLVLAGRLKRSTHGVGKWLGYIDKFVFFPAWLRVASRWADVVHICDHSNATYTRYLGTKPNVVTCHDMLAIRSALGEIEQNPTRWTGRQLQLHILNGLKKAQYIACVSQATLDDLDRIAQLGNRSVVIHNSLSFPYTPMPLKSAHERLAKLGVPVGERFLLHVGGNQWYKNRLGVLQIYSRLLEYDATRNLKLVMVGRQWTAAMNEFVTAQGLEAAVIRLSNVSNEDLRALYSTATALLFPSLQEGFGWPIVEAQSCGCTVFTSDRAPMNQIGGDAAIYIDPQNPGSAAAIIATHLGSSTNRRDSNLKNAARFTESEMMGKYISVYNHAVNANSSQCQFAGVAE